MTYTVGQATGVSKTEYGRYHARCQNRSEETERRGKALVGKEREGDKVEY